MHALKLFSAGFFPPDSEVLERKAAVWPVTTAKGGQEANTTEEPAETEGGMNLVRQVEISLKTS